MAIVYELDDEPPYLIENGRVYVMMNVLMDQITSADDYIARIPDEYQLQQNYPNPFNPATTIQFSLPVSGEVQLVIYDILGRKVETLVDGYKNAGHHEAVFNAGELSSGVYLYQLRAGEFVNTKRLMLVK